MTNDQISKIRQRMLEAFLNFGPAQELKLGDVKYLSNMAGTIAAEVMTMEPIEEDVK